MADRSRPVNSDEERALVEAYHEVAPRVRRLGLRLAVDGEDVAQDAYMRVLGTRRRDPINAPVAFLFRIARNLFVDRQRNNTRERALFDRSVDRDVWSDQANDPERILVGKQRLAVVMQALGALPPRCREAFTLHRFEGLTYTAIARRMGISTSMVEKHIADAMFRLGDALRRSDEHHD